MLFTLQKLRLSTLPISLAITAAAALPGVGRTLCAQAPVAVHATPQRGTVKAIEGSNLRLSTDAGQEIVVAVPASARIQRLAPGSTDLKTAEAATLPDVAVGDRILVTGASGDSPGTFSATRVILMKSGDIAQRHEAEQQDWKRGAGGIVSAVDPAAGTIAVTSGTKKLQIVTDPKTSFRRYADGSVRFEDAKPGTLAEIHAGDQMLARGSRSDDGTSFTAEEVVSGSFRNVSGTILSVDAATNTVSLRDLLTKRNVTVQVTPNCALHRLPLEAAARLAAHAGAGSSTTTSPTPGAHAAPSASAPGPRPSTDRSAEAHTVAAPRSGGGDLAQVVARLPTVPFSDLHAGDAVMLVAEQTSASASSLTAITLLAGVEPILAAAPSGSPAMTLSPWSVGTGSPEGGGSQ